MRAAHVHAMRAELEPRFRQLFALRSSSPELEARRAELLASWEHWRELEASGLSDESADQYAAAGQQLRDEVGRMAGAWSSRRARTGFTMPGEVAGYHRLWDEYVRGVEAACAACSARLLGSEAGKAYDRRREALRTGWDAQESLSDSEAMLSGKALLDLYRTTVSRAREFHALIKREFPDVPRPSMPTGVLQAAVIGELEGAGLVAKGSMEIVADSAVEVAEGVAKAARQSTPFVALGIFAGVTLLVLARR
jgi:hypothetical protein